MVGEVKLEAGDAGQGAGRGTDLGGEVRQRGQVVAERRRFLGEAVPRQLHAVAGVARETDNDTVKLLDLLGHSKRTSSTRRGRAPMSAWVRERFPGLDGPGFMIFMIQVVVQATRDAGSR